MMFGKFVVIVCIFGAVIGALAGAYVLQLMSGAKQEAQQVRRVWYMSEKGPISMISISNEMPDGDYPLPFAKEYFRLETLK